MTRRTGIQDLIAQILGRDALTVVEIARRAGTTEMGAQSAVRAMEQRREVVRVGQGQGQPFRFRLARRSPA
ncbi:hypothetical protein [Luteibacter yeojuensis]|uniref:MarR family transcriptional regulator n=1 Tax=Luteibacter yeojuensis TaxID=345309 RepID=A0A7X5TPE9_9GAMM|nr:hypothetical protein [Luteibacter yeojuensis]NID14990.1 hypothetical protein [Luteibacter yeojuensis]